LSLVRKPSQGRWLPENLMLHLEQAG